MSSEGTISLNHMVPAECTWVRIGNVVTISGVLRIPHPLRPWYLQARCSPFNTWHTVPGTERYVTLDAAIQDGDLLRRQRHYYAVRVRAV